MITLGVVHLSLIVSNSNFKTGRIYLTPFILRTLTDDSFSGKLLQNHDDLGKSIRALMMISRFLNNIT